MQYKSSGVYIQRNTMENQIANSVIKEILALPYALQLAQLIQKQPTSSFNKWILTGEYTPGLLSKDDLSFFKYSKDYVIDKIVERIPKSSKHTDIIEILGPYVIRQISKRPDINTIIKQIKSIVALDHLMKIDRFIVNLPISHAIPEAKWLLTGKFDQNNASYLAAVISFSLKDSGDDIVGRLLEVNVRQATAQVLVGILRAMKIDVLPVVGKLLKNERLPYLFDQVSKVLSNRPEYSQDLNFLYQTLIIQKPEAPEVPNAIF